jgi:hypothetical protein
MFARRILVLMLMWLIPHLPVLGGVVTHQPSSSAPDMHLQAAEHAAHDCCNTAQADDYQFNAGSSCETGKCVSHCVVSLLDSSAFFQSPTASVQAQPSIALLAGIRHEPPLRPPSLP